MPRRPTGRPPGRPLGTGILGEQTRFTVRIPTPLYERLEAHAASTTEAAPLAESVRKALEHYLGCPYTRQTGIQPHSPHNGQTQNGTGETPPVSAPAVVPDVDPHKYVLGSACKYGHRSHGAAGNRRELVSHLCVTCREEKRAARQRARVTPQEGAHAAHC